MDLSTMIVNLANDISVVGWRLLWSIAGLVGLLYGAGVVLKWNRSARVPGASPVTMGELIPILIIGGVLMNLSKFINSAWNTIGQGTVSYGPISYQGVQELGRFASTINAVLTIGSLFGGVFVFKGVTLLKKSVEGQSSQGAEDHVWRAIIQIFFGACLVQVPDFIDAARASLKLYW